MLLLQTVMLEIQTLWHIKEGKPTKFFHFLAYSFLFSVNQQLTKPSPSSLELYCICLTDFLKPERIFSWNLFSYLLFLYSLATFSAVLFVLPPYFPWVCRCLASKHNIVDETSPVTAPSACSSLSSCQKSFCCCSLESLLPFTSTSCLADQLSSDVAAVV